MSFHGGFLGVLVAMGTRKHGKHCLTSWIFVAPLVPLGLAAGRIGNFINGELWGRIADPRTAVGHDLPQSGDMQPRHRHSSITSGWKAWRCSPSCGSF